MITKRYDIKGYILMTHIYTESTPFKFGALIDGKYDKYNGQRLEGQLIGLGWHFSFTFFCPIRNRIKAV